jgi:hypothetical protein
VDAVAAAEDSAPVPCPSAGCTWDWDESADAGAAPVAGAAVPAGAVPLAGVDESAVPSAGVATGVCATAEGLGMAPLGCRGS